MARTDAQLTQSELDLINGLASNTYQDGDMIYWNGTKFTNDNRPIVVDSNGNISVEHNITTIVTGTATDVQNWRVVRNASYTGGTAGFVNSGLRVTTNVGADADAYEWSILGVVNSASDTGENVAVYGQANGTGAGTVWAGVMEANTSNGGTLVGLEVSTNRSAGADAPTVGVDVVDVNGMNAAVRVPEGVPGVVNANYGTTDPDDYLWFPATGRMAVTTRFQVGDDDAVNSFGSAQVINSDKTSGAAGSPSLIIQGEGNKERLGIFSYGGGGSFVNCNSARGTMATPTATQNGDLLGGISGGGYGATGYAQAKGYLLFSASQNFTDSANGTLMQIQLTPDGSTSRETSFVFQNNHDLILGSLAGAEGRLYAANLNVLDIAASAGEVDYLSIDENGNVSNVKLRQTKAITIESPGASEDITMFFTDDAITVTQMNAVLNGSSTPSVTWTIRHNSDRSATGNEVVTGGTTTTSTTTGSEVTSFNDATIPAGSWVWLETTAQSGTVDALSVTIEYTID